MYNFRIYPREKHIKKMFKIFDNSTEVWNDLLDKKSSSWKNDKVRLDRKQLYKIISENDKRKEWYSLGNSHIYQNTAVRLINSYKGFFSRCKNPSFINKKKGYPKEKKRTYSLTFPEYDNGCRIDGKNLWLSKIGSFPIVVHRELPHDIENIKTVTIKRKPSGKWYACFSLDICNNNEEDNEKNIDLSRPVGIDVGCPNIVNLSDDSQIPNPKYYLKSQKRLKLFQRRVSRKHKKVGKKVFSNKSNNRRKAVRKLVRLHEKIDNQRNDFQHKLSSWIVKNYTFIAVEKLNIFNMVRNHCLAKSIQDSSWGSLIQKIDYKSNGSMFKNPKTKYSSCKCCLCNNIQENPLDKGLDDYICNNCGNVMQKDWNASINHLKDTLESLGLRIGIIKVNDVYILEANNKIIQLNQTKYNDTVGNTEISTLVDISPLLCSSKKNRAREVEETGNTSVDV
jgi:putative transposase